MKKAVLISIRPKWVELIASGEKTIEVRKSAPKLGTPFKCYIYCTLTGAKELAHSFGNSMQEQIIGWNKGKWGLRKGNVVGEFVCDKIDEVYQCHSGFVMKYGCMSRNEFFDYLGIQRGTHFGYDKKAYAWHISNLKIYDQPKALSEFRKPCTVEFNSFACRGCDYYNYHLPLFDGVADLSKSWCSDGSRIIKRPPQSWCYVEEVEE